MFDLISTVGITAVSVVLATTLAATLGTTARVRATIAAGLGIWFAALLATGATGLLDAGRGIGIFGFNLAVGLPMVVLVMAVFGTRAGRAAVASAPLPVLVGSQTIRLTGICFVLLYAQNRLPAPFAPVAGWGDVLVGGLAPLVTFAAVRASASARLPILAWNALGLLDVVAAVVLGTASSPGPTRIFTAGPDTQIMTGLPWIFIPCFLVPLDALVHLMIFAKLKSSRAANPEAIAVS